MGRLGDGAGRFAAEFEEMLLGIVGVYVVVVTAIVCAVGGMFLAEWAWPRVQWFEMTLIVIGIVIGSAAGLFAIAALHERMSAEGRSRLLWFLLALIPGAAIPIGIAEMAIRLLRAWSRREP